jgi:hypothetical protein
MIELRFHRDLYRADAVADAASRFTRVAEVEAIDAPARFPEHLVVRVSAARPDRERVIARELANHALGLTVQAAPGAK